MNVVFLDIDGVLNNLGSVIGLGNPSKFFDPVSVALVERLCREGDAKIVISSSWRIGKIYRLIDEMTKCGAGRLREYIIGETPNLPGMRRGDEIARYLDEHAAEVASYVILDDDSDMLEHQPLVQTTFEDGFRYRHYVAALRHLDPDHPDCRERALIVPETA